MKTKLLAALLVLATAGYAQGSQGSVPTPMPESGIRYLGNTLIVQGVYVRTLGNFAKAWPRGSGLYATYEMFFPAHYALDIQVGYLNYQLSDEIQAPDAYFRVIPLWVGGRYQFTDGLFVPYISFMNGINIMSQNARVEADSLGNVMLDGSHGEETLVKYSWQLGLGLKVHLFSGLGLDLAARYNSHFYSHEAMLTGFEYSVGLGWTFRR